MNTASPRDVTRLLQTWGRGEEGILRERIPLVQGELCGQAPHQIGRDRPGPTLQTTVAARAQ